MNQEFKKSDLIAILIIGEAVGWFLLPVAQNLGIKLSFLIYLLPVAMPILALVALYVFYLLGRKIRPVFFEMGKFASTGILNTAVDFGVLNLLSYSFNAHAGTLVAVFNVVSVSLSIVNSYFWNKFWTFRVNATDEGAKDFAQFVFVSLVGLGINTAIIYFLTTFVAPAGISKALWENIAKVIGVPVYLTWNFLGYKFWVFKRS